MHRDEVHTSAALVKSLLVAQFPAWAELSITPVSSAGTDNALYRLGADMAVRLPRIPSAAEQVEMDHRWLPRLAPLLPLPIPVPRALGQPGAGFPWRWGVYPWLPGQDATAAPIADLGLAARDLAAFIAALRHIEPTGGPPPREGNAFRGVPLADRDAAVRAALAALHGSLETATAAAAWEASLRAPVWQNPPVWLHGDLQPLNLLVQQGRLSAVIDFGCLGVGDPACDLIVAWQLLNAESRAVLRAALADDDATWVRGRGWALSMGLLAVPYYRTTNPTLAAIGQRAITEAMEDYLGGA
jgi:aminoglycoside phosphotransferase (APT) family kinase protein